MGWGRIKYAVPEESFGSPAMITLLEGHNSGRWKITSIDPINGGILDIEVKGQRSGIKYYVNGSGIIRMTKNHLRDNFCVQNRATLDGRDRCAEEYLLSRILFIKYQEKYLLENATYKYSRTALGELKVLFLALFVQEPLVLLLVVIVLSLAAYVISI